MKSLISMFVLMLLAGCLSHQERAWRLQQQEAQRQAQERAYMDALASRCAQFGYRPGEQRHSDCMMGLHQQDQAARSAAAAAMVQGAAAEKIRQEAEDARERQRLIYQPIRRY